MGFKSRKPGAREAPATVAIAVRQRATLREARRAFEQRYVAKVMDKCDGNRERVIAWLGISRSSLKEKLADGRED